MAKTFTITQAELDDVPPGRYGRWPGVVGPGEYMWDREKNSFILAHGEKPFQVPTQLSLPEFDAPPRRAGRGRYVREEE
jgi:hypothetical protein